MPNKINITNYDRDAGMTNDNDFKPFYHGVDVGGEHYLIEDDDWDDTAVDDTLKRAFRLTSYDEETGNGTAEEITDSGLLKRVFNEQFKKMTE